MIASVIPLVKLPRRFGVFDYTVLPADEPSIRPGVLVTIPFRAKTIFGIVYSISSEQGPTDNTLKTIQGVVYPTPLFSNRQLELMSSWSQRYGISLSHSALLFTPPLQKRKLAAIKSTIPALVLVEASPKKPQVHVYLDEAQHKSCIEHAITDTSLILVPTVADIPQVLDRMPPHLHSRVVTWHSTLSTKEQFEHWWDVRRGTKTIIVGTRSAVFLPFTNLTSIIIERAHDENHKHWDQAPRFDVRDLAYDLAKIIGTELHVFDYYPSVATYAKIFSSEYSLCTKQQLTKQDRLFPTVPLEHLPTIVDMRDERKARNYTLLSDRATDTLSSLAGDMLFVINRLGFATSVGCHDCGFVLTCTVCSLPLVYHETTRMVRCSYGHMEKPMVLVCPQCASPVVQMRGAGTELVEKEVRRILGDKKTHRIIRIDSETDFDAKQVRDPTPKIIIGTSMALQYINWKSTDAIVYLDVDKQLALPEYRASEEVWHAIQNVQEMRLPTSQYFVQTFHPEHVVFRSLREPDRYYRTELSGRKTHGYPPYQYLVRYLIGGQDQNRVAAEAKMMYTKAKDALTETKKSCTILPPIEAQPKSYRGQYWSIIIAKLSIETWQTDLNWLNSILPGNWKVDPNPLSLLQP